VNTTLLTSINSATAQYSLDHTNVFGFDIYTVDTLLLKQRANITYINVAQGCYWNGQETTFI
jgi:hypothetical protein